MYALSARRFFLQHWEQASSLARSGPVDCSFYSFHSFHSFKSLIHSCQSFFFHIHLYTLEDLFDRCTAFFFSERMRQGMRQELKGKVSVWISEFRTQQAHAAVRGGGDGGGGGGGRPGISAGCAPELRDICEVSISQKSNIFVRSP